MQDLMLLFLLLPLEVELETIIECLSGHQEAFGAQDGVM